MMTNKEHTPVLLNEVIEGLAIKKNGIYLDLTLGRAGHSQEILKRLTTGTLIGVDQDEEALIKSDEVLKQISSNYELVKTNFVNIKEILLEKGIKEVDGILMDLGVSSPQLDEGDRGFSYRFDNELDMRMDRSNPLTAKTIVNTYSYEKLVKIFREYGEDKYSANIARNIVKERNKKTIETTLELVEIIKRSKPQKELRQIGHPAKQIFQALRIEVNDELNVLKKTLNDVIPMLRSKGRIAVITFHSLEDRIVKNIFKEYAVVEGSRENLPIRNEEKDYVLVNKKVIIASDVELKMNHRSASAKLRILERK